MNNRLSVFMISILIAITGQAVYLGTSYKKEQQNIALNQSEIKNNTIRLENMKENIIPLNEAKGRLNIIENQKEELLSHFPPFKSSAKEAIELIRYVNTFDFTDIELNLVSQEDEYEGDIRLNRRIYEIKWVGVYEAAAEFISEINQSNQVLAIKKLIIDNEIQEADEEKRQAYYEHYNEAFNQLVKVSLELCLYGRIAKEDSEVFQPDFNLVANSKNIFSRSTNQEGEEGLSGHTQNVFAFEIGEYLKDSSNCQIEAPGERYISLSTGKNLTASLLIRSDGYHIKVMNEQGEVYETSMEQAVYLPEIVMTSVAGDISRNMPLVKMTIYNQTEHEVTVLIADELTGNIEVKDEKGEQIMKGQSSGGIKII